MGNELKEVVITVESCVNYSVMHIELREGDMLKFGYSTRSYVLMNEHSIDTAEPERDENEVKSDNEDDLNKMV